MAASSTQRVDEYSFQEQVSLTCFVKMFDHDSGRLELWELLAYIYLRVDVAAYGGPGLTTARRGGY